MDRLSAPNLAAPPEMAARLFPAPGEVDAFVYFNNDWEASAVRNASWLAGRLAEMAGERG